MNADIRVALGSLPRDLWCVAAIYASRSRNVLLQVPFDTHWLKTHPYHSQIFGTGAVIHTRRNQQGKKLENPGKMAYFIGYCTDQLAFQFIEHIESDQILFRVPQEVRWNIKQPYSRSHDSTPVGLTPITNPIVNVIPEPVQDFIPALNPIPIPEQVQEQEYWTPELSSSNDNDLLISTSENDSDSLAGPSYSSITCDSDSDTIPDIPVPVDLSDIGNPLNVFDSTTSVNGLRRSTRHARLSTTIDQEDVFTTQHFSYLTSLVQSELNQVYVHNHPAESIKWTKAENEELTNLLEFQTYDIVDTPNTPILTSRWVYDIKSNGTYRARLVAHGFKQEHGVNYEKTYSPVASYDSWRSLLTIGVSYEYDIDHLGFSRAFLQADIDVPVYLSPPSNVTMPHGKCWLLKKAIYGLKQAPMLWYKKLTNYLKTLDFKPIANDSCVFVKGVLNSKTFAAINLFVDDITLVGSPDIIKQIKSSLKSVFQVKDLGPLERYCGIRQRIDGHQPN
jgi:hypothetical protein